MKAFIAFGQYETYSIGTPTVMGFVVMNNRYRFHHWKDKDEWHGDHGILKEDKVRFYIQFIF